MKKFTNNFLKFSLIFIGSILLLVLARTLVEKSIVNFKLSPNKTVLVIGDSHSECAINDSIVTNAFNFSRSGTAYIYSYLKIREILAHNPQIKTVVLSYSYKSIAKYKDSWFSEVKYIKNFMPEHFFLFEYSNFYSLLMANSYGVIINIPRIIFKNINSLKKLGGYLPLKENKLEESKKHFNYNTGEKVIGYSEYQVEYLIKIYELAISKNVDLILLNLPMHPFVLNSYEKYKENYYSFAQQNLPEAKIINHSNFYIPDYGFRDLYHLNYKGAKIYSEYLQKKGF